jgi:hypothetical protein
VESEVIERSNEGTVSFQAFFNFLLSFIPMKYSSSSPIFLSGQGQEELMSTRWTTDMGDVCLGVVLGTIAVVYLQEKQVINAISFHTFNWLCFVQACPGVTHVPYYRQDYRVVPHGVHLGCGLPFP